MSFNAVRSPYLHQVKPSTGATSSLLLQTWVVPTTSLPLSVSSTNVTIDKTKLEITRPLKHVMRSYLIGITDGCNENASHTRAVIYNGLGQQDGSILNPLSYDLKIWKLDASFKRS